MVLTLISTRINIETYLKTDTPRNFRHLKTFPGRHPENIIAPDSIIFPAGMLPMYGPLSHRFLSPQLRQTCSMAIKAPIIVEMKTSQPEEKHALHNINSWSKFLSYTMNFLSPSPYRSSSALLLKRKWKIRDDVLQNL